MPNFRSFWDRLVTPSASATREKCTEVYYLCQGDVGRIEVGGEVGYEAMLQLSRTSGFAEMAAITVQIAGDADRFGKDAKRIVGDAWEKVGL